MGCASSRDRCIGAPPPPHHPSLSSPSSFSAASSPLPTLLRPPVVGRSLTLPSPIVVHHPPLHQGDSHHLVSLTSTTYGSLFLLDTPPADDLEDNHTPTAVINAWELMDGLDDAASPAASRKPHLLPRSLTYHHHHQYRPAIKPLWRHLADDDPKRPAPRAVLYTTSLRSIRRTHEDCYAVRAILRGLRVAVDERDVSMDAAYRRELQALLAASKPPRPLSLPQLFVGGKCVGGAEEVRQLHEAGELGKILEGVPVQDPGFVCAGCGGARFVPCTDCNGSRKVFVEDEGRMRRCDECNENGLERCPNCCSY